MNYSSNNHVESDKGQKFYIGDHVTVKDIDGKEATGKISYISVKGFHLERENETNIYFNLTNVKQIKLAK